MLEDLQKDIKGLVWWFFGIFLGLSLFSYHPKDPSFSSSGDIQTSIQNYCGYFGSFLSDAMYQFLGLMSWTVVLACFHLGLKSFRKQESFFRITSFLWLILFMGSLTTLLSLYFPEWRWKEGEITMGGFLGLLFSTGLVSVFNSIGTQVILWALSLLFWVLYTERSFGQFLEWPLKRLSYVLMAIYSVFQFFGFVARSFFSFLGEIWASIKYRSLHFKQDWKKEFHRNRKDFPFFVSFFKTFDSFFLPPMRTQSVDVFDVEEQKKKRRFKKDKTLFFPIPEEEQRKEKLLADEESEEEYEEEREENEREEEEGLGEEEIETDGEEEEVEEDEEAGEEEWAEEESGKGREEGKRVSSSSQDSKAQPLDIDWKFPPLALFKRSSFLQKQAKINKEEVKEKAKSLKEKLEKFHIRGEIVGFRTGPAVTLFEFKPEPDVKISRITELADDLSLALSSESVRIIAPIPGRNVVGIETANSLRENVSFRDLLLKKSKEVKDMKLPIALGLRADGLARFVDLRKMPHMMVAGSTGSGKSAFILSALTGLLLSHSPKTLRLILIDPKQVDLMSFRSLPHLLMPPLRTPQTALEALRWVLNEMEERYHSMSVVGAKHLESFNEIVSSPSFSLSSYQQVDPLDASKKKKRESKFFSPSSSVKSRSRSSYFVPQPYIIVVIEEFGDLMAVDKAPVEKAVVKLAQMARACGIHLILAMQSPRRDVITGLIKTNIPGRISFKVASKLDSRIILDESGAERLLNCGDMLFLAPGFSQPERCHGPWVEEKEILQLIEFWKSQTPSSFPSPAFEGMTHQKSFLKRGKDSLF